MSSFFFYGAHLAHPAFFFLLLQLCARVVHRVLPLLRNIVRSRAVLLKTCLFLFLLRHFNITSTRAFLDQTQARAQDYTSNRRGV